MKPLVCKYTGYPELLYENEEDIRIIFYPFSFWIVDNNAHNVIGLKYTFMSTDLAISLGGIE